MSVPLAAMDYILYVSPRTTCAVTPENPYVLVLATGAVFATGAGGRNTRTTVDSDGNTVYSHKSMELPVEVRERFPDNEEGLQLALDTYKWILYGPNMRVMTTLGDYVGGKITSIVSYKPRLRQIQTDQHGALSFSNANANQSMCVAIVAYIKRNKIDMSRLSITDATASCGGDSMQFLMAKNNSTDIDTIFSKVTSIEIHDNRIKMLKNNMDVVYNTFNPVVEYKVIHANYGDVLGILPERMPKYMTGTEGGAYDLEQDVVYIDPPWGGKSSEQSRTALTLYSLTEDPKLIAEFEGDNLVIDYHLSVDLLIEGIITRNNVLQKRKTGGKETSVVAVKTPMYWQNDMVDKVRQLPGYLGSKTVRCGRYDVVLFYLRTSKTPLFVQEVFELGQLKGFMNWQQQQEKLLQMFPRLKEGNYCTEEQPVFLQNIWPNMDGSMGADLDAKWNEKYVRVYEAGALHHHTYMHSGEKKLLHSSLYTILYGLFRIKEQAYFEEMSWNQVLQKTIVLYVGAAGLSKESHHFNELLRAIPGVHFACYDIRKVETTLAPHFKDRMTVFHKIFTNNDLERWVAFANKYTDKPIIFISDIRTDWTAAMNEMDASKSVALKKIWLLKSLQALPTPRQDAKRDHTRDSAVHGQADERARRITEVRQEIDLLFQHNRAISLWVDRQVETDNFVQWRWFRRMQEATTTCAIMSSKTREPYQTAANPEQTFSYFPGLILFQTGTSASTEGRTQCCPDNFNPRETKSYQEKDRSKPFFTGKSVFYSAWDVKTCIDRHFRSKGDPTSFVTENIDYTREWHPSFDNAEDNRNIDLCRQSVHMHDSKMAYYNSDYKQTEHRRFTYEAVKIMYDDFKKALAIRTANQFGVIIKYDVIKWFDDNDKKVAERANAEDDTTEEQLEHAPKLANKSGWSGLRRRNDINLDEIIRDNNDAAVTAHISEATKPAWANVSSMTRYFSPQATMRRYEWHLLASDKIWDISRAAMEALLILNMQLKRHPATTKRDVANYGPTSGASYMPVHLDRRLNEAEKQTLRAQKMPPRWVLSQLRFNLQNPYRGTMYDKTVLHLFGRYEMVTDLMHTLVAEAIATNTQSSPLMYKPGSACGDVAVRWVESRISKYESRDTSPGGTDLARDWYCYWLCTLLENRDGSDLKDNITVKQIEEAIRLFFARSNNTISLGSQYRLLRSQPLEMSSESPPRPPLDLALWPRGKPVLYFACERGCRAMIEFCLLGFTPEENRVRINTPRRQHMRLTREIIAARALENGKSPPEVPDTEQGRLPDTDVENFPLHTAVWNGQAHIVQFLLDLGANPDLLNHWNETALRCVEASKHEYAYSSAKLEQLQACTVILEEHYKKKKKPE